MAVKAGELDNPEQDLDLANREPKGAKKVAADIERVKHGTPTAETELEALRERIAAAKALDPKDPVPHCADCYSRGFKAAVRMLSEGT